MVFKSGFFYCKTKGKHENNQITILALITKRNRSEKGKEMNANELSDELQDLYKNYCHANAIKEAVTMLRQQKLKIDNLLENNARLDAEIEELKHDNAELVKINNELATEVIHPTQETINERYETIFDGEKYTTKLKDAPECLDASLKQEPVAIRYDFDGYGYQYIDSGSGSDWQTRVDGEPLYTHPVKELTDEEILKLEEIEFENYCVDKESRGRKTATITDPEWAIWFAKAILRKAQEK